MVGKPYSKLGEVLDELARRRYVRGPYRIALHLQETTGFEIAGNTISDYFYGKARPSPKFNDAFVEAFSLNEDEIIRLAIAYSFEEDRRRRTRPRRRRPRRSS